jgi:acetyl esterase/lipase
VHVDSIKGPLLVIQGANDTSVDREQSDLMVSAVKAKNVPVTYLLYPDEGHGLQRSANNLSAHIVADRFLANCLGGRSEPIDATSLVGSSVQVVEGREHIPGLASALDLRGESASQSSVKSVH